MNRRISNCRTYHVPVVSTWILLLLALPVAAMAGQTPDPEALWHGEILYKPGMTEIEIVVELAKDHTGEMGGTISIPLHGLRYITLEAFELDGSDITFTFTRYSERAKVDVVSPFNGKISSDGRTISGTFVEGGVNSYPFVLRRMGEAGSELPEPERPELHDLSDHGEELKALFNQHADKVRLVLMVSPTCPFCLGNARMVQRYVMNRIDDDAVRVYTVWGPMQGNEERTHAVAATSNLVDDRVTHFWTPKHTLAEAYMKPLGLENDKEPAWDTYLVYGSGVEWKDGPPVPSYFMYVEKPLPPEGVLNVVTVAEKVKEFLAAR